MSNTRFRREVEHHLPKKINTHTAGEEMDEPAPSSESGIEDGFLTSKVNAVSAEFDIEPNQVTPDVNIYQHKKTLAQGMMDLALLSANANQLRYVLESQGDMSYYIISLVLISISITLQVGVGVMLIWNSRYNVKKHEDMCRANRVNNLTVCCIFLITITNVFIAVFVVNPSIATLPLPVPDQD